MLTVLLLNKTDTLLRILPYNDSFKPRPGTQEKQAFEALACVMWHKLCRENSSQSIIKCSNKNFMDELLNDIIEFVKRYCHFYKECQGCNSPFRSNITNIPRKTMIVVKYAEYHCYIK